MSNGLGPRAWIEQLAERLLRGLTEAEARNRNELTEWQRSLERWQASLEMKTQELEARQSGNVEINHPEIKWLN